MKVLVRTFIILLAAAVVTVGTMGAMQLPAVQTWVSSQGGEHGRPPGTAEGSERVAAASDATAAGAQVRPERGEGERGGHNQGGNLLGLAEVVKNLVFVTVVSLAIAAAGWAARRLRTKRRAAAATM